MDETELVPPEVATAAIRSVTASRKCPGPTSRARRIPPRDAI